VGHGELTRGGGCGRGRDRGRRDPHAQIGRACAAGVDRPQHHRVGAGRGGSSADEAVRRIQHQAARQPAGRVPGGTPAGDDGVGEGSADFPAGGSGAGDDRRGHDRRGNRQRGSPHSVHREMRGTQAGELHRGDQTDLHHAAGRDLHVPGGGGDGVAVVRPAGELPVPQAGDRHGPVEGQAPVFQLGVGNVFDAESRLHPLGPFVGDGEGDLRLADPHGHAGGDGAGRRQVVRISARTVAVAAGTASRAGGRVIGATGSTAAGILGAGRRGHGGRTVRRVGGGRRRSHRSGGGTVIDAAVIQIAGGEEHLPHRVDPLPDHVKNVAALSRRQLQGHEILLPGKFGGLAPGDLLEVAPFQRQPRIKPLPGEEGSEEARLVHGGGHKTGRAGPGLHLGGRPVGPGQVQPGVFRPARPRKLPIRHEGRIVVGGDVLADLVPVVEGLGPREGDRRFGGRTLGGFGTFQEHLVNPADGIGHRAVAVDGPRADEKGRRDEGSKDGDVYFHGGNVFPESPPRHGDSARRAEKSAKRVVSGIKGWF